MVEATHENWTPQKFYHLDSLLNGKMAAEFRKKLCVRGYNTYNNIIWETSVGKMLVCMREPRNAHDRYAVVGNNYSWWQIFHVFNFVVEGTHKNFNTTKISAYTVLETHLVVVNDIVDVFLLLLFCLSTPLPGYRVILFLGTVDCKR